MLYPKRALLTCLTTLLCLWAANLSATIYCDGDVWITMGYRWDEFKWSITGPDHVPNILSELEWEKLGVIEASAMGWNSFENGFYYRWGASYGTIIHGEVTDSDYLGDDRTLLYSRSKSMANRGKTLDFTGCIGWQCSCFSDSLVIAGIVGMSVEQQHLHLIGGHLVVNVFDPDDVGEIHGLNSEYEPTWWGPWIGLDAGWAACPDFVFSGGIEYHWTKYDATGHWNLRSDFCGDFTQESKGTGFVGHVGISYAFRRDWLFILNLKGQHWRAHGGTDTCKIRVQVVDEASGAVFTECQKIHTPFKEAVWSSYSAALGVEYRY